MEHDHTPHLYEDGCALCQAQDSLLATATHGSGVPWSTPEYDEGECVRLIRQIVQAHRNPPAPSYED